MPTSFAPRWLFALLLFGLAAAAPAYADVIEFLSGTKLEGKVAAIDKQARTVTFEALVADVATKRTFPYDRIHAVTMGDKRYVITPKPDAAGKSKPEKTADSATAGPAKTLRSRAEIDKLINETGKSPPDWLESTPLDYPKTLDLDWPEKAPEGWNNQTNVGQYVWDIVNPNPNRWRSGVRLTHHLLSLHQDDPNKRRRAMMQLASMYFRFFQDYPRAAFWWRQAKPQITEPDYVSLAECYWRLGNKQMATELLKIRTLRPEMVKLWGDMGDAQQALATADQLADMMTKQGLAAAQVYLYAGDACRLAGRYGDAQRYYQKTLDEPATLKGRVELPRKRATANLEAIRLYQRSDPARVADGVYRASSLGYEADIEVEVTVRAHRIEDVKIVQHKEKQFYSALADVPAQILRKQGVKGVDATSKATVTAEAVLNAAAKALASGADP